MRKENGINKERSVKTSNDESYNQAGCSIAATTVMMISALNVSSYRAGSKILLILFLDELRKKIFSACKVCMYDL